MSESDTPQDVENTASDDPTASAPVRFMGQYIKDLSFEVPNAPDIYNLLRQKAPDIPISLETSAQHINAGVFEVKLNVSLRAMVEDKTAFILELVYGCLAEVNPKALPEEHVHPFLHIEVPRQMFPFVRQIVSDMTVSGGFPPLLLQIVDFNEIYRRKFGGAAQANNGAAPAETPAADPAQTTT